MISVSWKPSKNAFCRYIKLVYNLISCECATVRLYVSSSPLKFLKTICIIRCRAKVEGMGALFLRFNHSIYPPPIHSSFSQQQPKSKTIPHPSALTSEASHGFPKENILRCLSSSFFDPFDPKLTLDPCSHVHIPWSPAAEEKRWHSHWPPDQRRRRQRRTVPYPNLMRRSENRHI